MPTFPIPMNTSGLTALAMQLASDYLNGQMGGLDEVFPGTYAWQPEGTHDLIFSFSEKSKQGSLRVMKTQWNQAYSEFQHSYVPLSGFTNIPKGVGGPSVPQSWVDSQVNITPTQIATSGVSQQPLPPNISVNLSQTMDVGDTKAFVSQVNYLPTQNRWRGIISGSTGSETILFEGTSGGISVNGAIGFKIDVVYRGIDGTIPVQHPNTSVLAQVAPNATYGVNLVRHEKSQFVYPNEWTSGGIQAVNVVPQLQTVLLVDGSGAVYNGTTYFSGFVNVFDPTQQQPWSDAEPIYAVQRNSGIQVFSGYAYGGQLVGYSPSTNSGVVAPVYAIDDLPYLASGQGGGPSSGCCSGNLTFRPNPSLGTCFTNPSSVFSQGVFAQTPGIYLTNFPSVNASGCCYNQILACVQFPIPQQMQHSGVQQSCCQFSSDPNAVELVNGPCPPGTIQVDPSRCQNNNNNTQYFFADSCSITWTQTFRPGSVTQTAYWNGMCVNGSLPHPATIQDCTNTCDDLTPPAISQFGSVDAILFNQCDFTVQQSSVPCCSDNPNPTNEVLIQTVGLTKDQLFLDDQCNVRTLCIFRGLIKQIL